MKILIGSDHAGFDLKTKLVILLPEFEWADQGCFSLESVDYPDFADKVCREVSRAEENNNKENKFDSLDAAVLGLLICGSGQGMAMRANKYPHIRAALCWTTEVASLSREHNNANVLCLASRFTDVEAAAAMIKVFYKTAFVGGRHQKRVEKLSRITSS